MKKNQQKAINRRICLSARVVACISFLLLAIIGVSSLVRAMSLETIANENGIPAIWQAASLGRPATITVPATFWDQRQDDCDDPNRQFEWVICGYWTKGALQGVVKNTLGSDGLPVPAFTNSTDAWNANRDVFTANVTGNDPVQPTDNFYRWFHEVPNLSKRINGRSATFARVGNANTYSYGRDGIFPLDDVDFSKNDEATSKNGHNFHFTSSLRIPVKIAADGTEEFYFSGDDDVWVFLNNQLVLDIGGLHEKLEGRFKINTDGTVTTFVQHVNDVSGRAALGEPSNNFNDYVNPLNEYIMRTYKDTTKTIDIGLHEGDIVNLDFFYAERSTSESNTNITITNMNWPISADSKVTAKIAGKIDDTEHKLVEFNTHIKNRDPENPLILERLAAYVEETTDETHTEGYLPLDRTTLFYTTTPDNESSWQPIEISAPANSEQGFNLATPITMTPANQSGDTLYFRYFAETSEYSGELSSTVSYYTTLNGNAGVTYDYDDVAYTGITKPIITDQNLTIKYLYEDDTEAAPTYTATLKTGDTFDVPSPTITDHTPDYDKITGAIANQDLEYIVRYKPNSVNPGPDQPDPDPDQPDPGPNPGPDQPDNPTPEQPENPAPGQPENPTPNQPELPNLPTFPGSNTIDGNLLYLAPLGEVAFVPNTGIVSDAVANLFTEDFAEVILSQAFIMAILLIFAVSFCIYFSLRKFLVVAPVTRTASTRKMPQNNRSAAKKSTSRAKSTKASTNSIKSATRTAKSSAKTASSTSSRAAKSTKSSTKSSKSSKK